MPSKRITPQKNPKWKQHQGPHVIEFVEDINVRRKKRNDRRKTLFLKAHELSVLSGGSVFVMFKDDNDQTWSFASNEDLWERYCTTGLKQESGEKRCDKHSQIISISRDGKAATTVHRRVTIPTPSRTTEFDLSYTDVGNLSRIPVQSSTVFVNEMTDHFDTEVTFELDIQADMACVDVRTSTPTEENPYGTLSLHQHSPVILQNMTDHLPTGETFPSSIPQPQQSSYNLAATSDVTEQFPNLTTSADMNGVLNSVSDFSLLAKETQLDMLDSVPLSLNAFPNASDDIQIPGQLVLQAYPRTQDYIESAHTNLPVVGPIETSTRTQQDNHTESVPLTPQGELTKTPSISAQATDQTESRHMEQQTEHIETTSMASSSVSFTYSETITSPKTGTTMPTRTTASVTSDTALQAVGDHSSGAVPTTFDIVADSITSSPEGNVTEPGTPLTNTQDNPSGQDFPTLNATGDKLTEKAVTENKKSVSDGKKIAVGRFYSKAPKILVKRLRGPPSPKVVRKSRRSSTLSEPMRAILKTLKGKSKM